MISLSLPHMASIPADSSYFRAIVQRSRNIKPAQPKQLPRPLTYAQTSIYLAQTDFYSSQWSSLFDDAVMTPNFTSTWPTLFRVVSLPARITQGGNRALINGFEEDVWINCFSHEPWKWLDEGTKARKHESPRSAMQCNAMHVMILLGFNSTTIEFENLEFWRDRAAARKSSLYAYTDTRQALQGGTLHAV